MYVMVINKQSFANDITSACTWIYSLSSIVFLCTPQLLKLRSAPLPSWGPAMATNRTDRYNMDTPISSGPEPINITNTRDLLTVLRPDEFARLMGGSTSTINTGSSLTIATNVGSTYGSKTSV